MLIKRFLLDSKFHIGSVSPNRKTNFLFRAVADIHVWHAANEAKGPSLLHWENSIFYTSLFVVVVVVVVCVWE